MIVVGLPYAFQGQMRLDEITGGSPYGATTITKPTAAGCRRRTNWPARDSRASTRAIAAKLKA